MLKFLYSTKPAKFLLVSFMFNFFYVKMIDKEFRMIIETINYNDVKIAHIVAEKIVISNLQSAVDLIMTVNFEAKTKNIVISENLISDKFFILSSGLAGEVLQKIINYQFRIAIYGDFSKFTSKPLKDFIYESNNGKDVFFTESLESAVEKLAESCK